MESTLEQVCCLMYWGRYVQVYIYGPAAEVSDHPEVVDASQGIHTCVLVGIRSAQATAEAALVECLGGPLDGNLYPAPTDLEGPSGPKPYLKFCHPHNPRSVSVYRWDQSRYLYDPQVTLALRQA